MKAAIALLAVVAVSAVPFAFAKEFQPTPAQLEECADIGISADECTENAILTARSRDRHPALTSDQVQDPNIALIPIYAGIAIAFAAGVLYVRRTKDSRKPRQSH